VQTYAFIFLLKCVPWGATEDCLATLVGNISQNTKPLCSVTEQN